MSQPDTNNYNKALNHSNGLPWWGKQSMIQPRRDNEQMVMRTLPFARLVFHPARSPEPSADALISFQFNGSRHGIRHFADHWFNKWLGSGYTLLRAQPRSHESISREHLVFREQERMFCILIPCRGLMPSFWELRALTQA
jgi:hypothetical protein